MSYVKIPISDVKLGMYIRLPLSWWKHPFLKNVFRLSSPKELAILKGLTLKTIEYDPERSAVGEMTSSHSIPIQALPSPSPILSSTTEEALDLDTQVMQKKRQIQFLRQRRQNLIKREQEYHQAFLQVSKILRSIESDQKTCVTAAQALLNHAVDTLIQDEETIIHLINLSEKDMVTYYHSLNVCILSLILGKKLGLSKEELNELGMGALFHDIGKQKIPKKILFKTSRLTRAETKYLELHPKYGVSMLAGNTDFSRRMLQVIYQHHEKCNGKGFPQGLRENDIAYFAKITAVVNIYDTITNHEIQGSSFTPHDALSFIYTQLRQELSQEIVSSFIKCLGIYPPGSLVELSDNSIGMVMTTDCFKSMKPTIILYDENVPRGEPLILNLTEEEVTIVRCLRPSDVPPEVVSYLRSGRMVGFFVGPLTGPGRTQKGSHRA